MYKKFFVILVITIAAAGIPVYASTYTPAGLPLQGKIIVLDAGHGVENSPAFAGYVESVRMLALAQMTRAVLESQGATVFLTREDEFDVLTSARVSLINKWALEAVRETRLTEFTYLPAFARNSAHARRLMTDIAEIDEHLELLERIIHYPGTYAHIYMNTPFDMTLTRQIHPTWQRIFELQDDPVIRYSFLAISLHSNAAGAPINTSINGADVFFSTNCNKRNMNYFSNYSHADISYLFADLILDGLDSLGIARREIIPHHWMIIRETNVPAVLVENGFHTNHADRALLMSNQFLSRLAQTYTNVIEQHFAQAPHLTASSPFANGSR